MQCFLGIMHLIVMHHVETSDKIGSCIIRRKIPSRGREPSVGLVQEASQCIHKISKCHWILEMNTGTP